MAKKLALTGPLRFVTKITARYCPFAAESKGTFEFVRRLGSPRMRESNPKLEVDNDIKAGHAPTVHIAFTDGQKFDVDATGKKVNDLFAVIDQHSQQIDLKALGLIA